MSGYSTILNHFDANFQIYSIKLVIIPSRDIWTWTHHHPSIELDFAVDQHENSLHDCLTVSSPTQGHWGLAVASYRWGRRDSCSPPSTEVEFHERNGALPSLPLFWTCQNCGFLLEKRLLILLIFFLCFHPVDFSTCHRGLDIWLHDAWKTYESTNVKNTLAPLPSPAILISRYAQLRCSFFSNRSQLSPSSEGFPWQRPYILLSGEKKPPCLWRFWILEMEFCGEFVHEVLWTSCSGTSWLCENIKGISCRSARSSLSFEASSPWKKALLPSKVLVTDTDSICDFSYLANWHTPQVHHNVRLEINDLMVIAWNKSKRKHAQVKLWYVVTSSTLSVDWKGWLIPYQEKMLIPMIFWSWVLGCLWTFPTDLLNHRVTGFKSQKLEKNRIPRNYDTKQNKVKKTCQWAEICQ